MKKIASKSLLSIFTCGFISISSQALDVNGVHIDNNIDGKNLQNIISDFVYLSTRENLKADENFLKILHKKELSNKDFVNVLTERVRYITGENFDISKNLYIANSDKVKISYPAKFTDFTEDNKNPFNTLMFNNEGKGASIAFAASKPSAPPPPVEIVPEVKPKVFTIMSNLASTIYSVGKDENKLAFAKLNDQTKVFGHTIRNGLIKVGEGLFAEELALKKGAVGAEVNIINRLTTYFHEGRHSDGHAEHLGFSHQKCPSGHPLEKDYACDASLNGSYSFGGYAGKALLGSAKTLNEKEKEMLQLRIADQFSRVVGITPERLVSYKNELKGLKKYFAELIKKPKENAYEIRMTSDYIKVIETMLKDPAKFSIRYIDDEPETAELEIEK